MVTNKKRMMVQENGNLEQRRSKSQIVAAKATTYSGPLPQAEEFCKYEEVCPGAADRIISMAERQAAHRQEIEKSVVKANNRNSLFGIFFAFILATAILFGGIWCIVQGHDWAGGVIVSLDLVSLCAVFVYGTNMRKQ